MSKPGVRLRSLASRVFHPDTMEYVIGPVLADLQLECTARQASRWRRSWVCLRAYLFFWSAVVAHLLRSLIEGSVERTADDQLAMRRVFIHAAAIGAIVTALLMAPAWLNRPGSTALPRSAFATDVALALLLIPQASPISIPAGMLFGILWAVRTPATRSIRRMILVLGIVCSLFSAAMIAFVIPEANQAYRDVVYQGMMRYGHPPAKGANELSWRELRDRINEENTLGGLADTRMLRLAYHTRIALPATPLIFAMFALLLVTRPRPFTSCFLGLLLFVGYYTLMVLSRRVADGTLSPIAVAWTPNLVVLALSLLSGINYKASSRFGPA
jgi:lipopolysaccharide export LptBFGC system permease protein LptF